VSRWIVTLTIAVEFFATMAEVALFQITAVVNIRGIAFNLTQIIRTNTAAMTGGALFSHVGRTSEPVTVTCSCNTDESTTNAVGSTDMALATSSMAAKAPQVKPCFNVTAEITVAAFSDQLFLTPEL